jgi:hypothetical protein
MYDKNTLTSLVQSSRQQMSMTIPKSLPQSEKNKLQDQFIKSVKKLSSGHEVLLIGLKM